MCRILLELLEKTVIWCAYYVMNFIDLVKLVVPREERVQRNNFKKNTSYTPNVHFVAIVTVS